LVLGRNTSLAALADTEVGKNPFGYFAIGMKSGIHYEKEVVRGAKKKK
jgi:hypothetical protein